MSPQSNQGVSGSISVQLGFFFVNLIQTRKKNIGWEWKILFQTIKQKHGGKQLRVSTDTHRPTDASAHTWTRMHTRTCVHTHEHVCTHMNMCTHIPPQTQNWTVSRATAQIPLPQQTVTQQVILSRFLSFSSCVDVQLEMGCFPFRGYMYLEKASKEATCSLCRS